MDIVLIAGGRATLDDQIAAILAAVDGADHPLVVGHSAATTLAWIAADRRPETIGGVALIGGFPNESGTAYADFFEMVDGQMAFPGWGPFEGADSADLDESHRRLVDRIAVPVPEQVATGSVTLADERRFALPVTIVCPEFNPEQAQQWIADGAAPELLSVATVEYENIDSGHWPMLTGRSNSPRFSLGRPRRSGRVAEHAPIVVGEVPCLDLVSGAEADPGEVRELTAESSGGVGSETIAPAGSRRAGRCLRTGGGRVTRCDRALCRRRT